MEPKIINIEKIEIIGMRSKLSLSNNKTVELWKKFMPKKKEIINLKNSWHYAVQIYDSDLKIKNLTPETIYEAWAAVEVSDIEFIPKGMESYTIGEGKYAVFKHKGDATAFQKTMSFIFGIWLVNSEYELDDREHFQIMKEKYLGENNPNSEEEVWVPIK